MVIMQDSGQMPGIKCLNSAGYLTCHQTSLGRSSSKKIFGITRLRKLSKALGIGNRATK